MAASRFAAGWNAKYYDRRVCMYVCLSDYLSLCLSVRSHISKITCPNSTKYVLPVLWMTLRFHIMGRQRITYYAASCLLAYLTRQLVRKFCLISNICNDLMFYLCV